MIPQRVAGSSTLAMLEKVRLMKERGEDVVSFAAGEADFQTPAPIVEEAYRSLKKGNTRYVSSQGITPLTQAIAEDYRGRLNASWVEKENVLVCAGAKQGIHLILSALLSPGDDVLMPAPYWVSYPGIAKSLSANPVIFQTRKENRFFPDIPELNAYLTPKTKALIFASPSNPTGLMIKEEQLKNIIRWSRENKVFLIFDELYEKLVFSDRKHVCPLSLIEEADSDYILSVNAFSKSFSMTGWRLGYIVAHQESIVNLTALQSQVLTCMPGFVQEAAVRALEIEETFLPSVLLNFKKRMEALVGGLNRIRGISAVEPEGAFYVLANVKELMELKGIQNDRELSRILLEEQQLVVNPGSAFGIPGYLRFSFATDLSSIHKGLDRLESFSRKNSVQQGLERL